MDNLPEQKLELQDLLSDKLIELTTIAKANRKVMDSREYSLFLTKLEEAEMWLAKI